MKNTIIRSKAPLRISLAGGGTDVSPYSDIYGGAILNATVSMYAYASIEPLKSGKIIFELADKKDRQEFESAVKLPTDSQFCLLAGIYNHIVEKFTQKPLSFKLTTYVDAPPGSGMGTSSTLVVAIIGAFAEWLKLPLGEYDVAHMAYDIERIDLAMAGGKQDQYAATFGGVNFMEFHADDKVIVNPLRIKDLYLNELSNNFVLYYTDTSRLSSKIIEEQQQNVIKGNTKSIEAMHQIKEQAVMMKETLLRGQLDKIGEILNWGWELKKQMANGISNPHLENIYSTAIQAGASGGKISGAGGGGFMLFYCPANSRFSVTESLQQQFGGKIHPYNFVNEGLTTWSF